MVIRVKSSISPPPKNQETESAKNGKLRLCSFYQFTILKEVTIILGNKDKDENKNLWQTVRALLDFCFSHFDLFWCLLVYGLWLSVLSSYTLHCISLVFACTQYHFYCSKMPIRWESYIT